MKFFDNAQIFGFTGTPIFTENAVDGHTTKEIFGNCLHKYLIKDAIADENVLGFLVEYYHGNEIVDNDNQARMEEIARFILNNFNKSTFDGEFDALFAVQSVPMLIRYYKIFKSLNPKIRIGAVFTYAANNSQDDEQTGMGTGKYVSENVGEADELQSIMDDYNENFGTSFTTENFRAYYDDINLRMKKKKAEMKPLDLCLVVGMFLTGFDSKKLNTLYVDKNMEYHGLLQAFSRTNRVLNEKKRFGKIVCFRDLKKEGITKANLFLDNRVDAKTMQSIYLNNREFINEVEVAIYDTTFHLLYHDAKQIDLVKETPEMIDRILQNKSIEFYQDGYQVIGLLYTFHGKPYVITAAAFDGYGYAKQHSLQTMLIVLFFLGIALLAGGGYLLSRSALAPVSDILGEVEAISASRLDLRVPVKDEKDELGELATTFNRMLERLEQSFDSQKMFVSNVSHELRTPMAALIAELELALLKERSSEEYRRAIGNALDDSRKLVKLSEGLLNLAKADYLPEQIKLEEIRLDELLLDAREMVMKANPDYTIELIFGEEADDDSVLTVLGNGYLLKTAFVNLMENNCKFSANHTSFVQISFWEQKSVIRFSDTGIGMNADDMQYLFSPFYRGSNKDYARGNGIGMMLTQKIIHTHKGEITVNSQPGEGTVYTVEIPHI